MSPVSQIDVNKAKELLDSGSANIVDIRDSASYSMAHIPNAINLNQDNAENFISSADKNKTLVVCCYHGISSQGAAQYFMESGFKDVHSLIGGFEAWQQNFPSES